MHQFVFINGPPHCGKDTLVSELVPYLKFRHLKFAAPIKRAVAGLFDVDVAWIESQKDARKKMLERVDMLNGMKPDQDRVRDLLIAMAEDLLKKRYGNDFFGKLLYNEALNSVARLIIISDSGFVAEAEHVIKRAQPKNCMLIQLHRNGCTFKDDSRSYIADRLDKAMLPWYNLDIDNNSTKHDLTMRALRAITNNFPNATMLREAVWLK